MNLQLEHKRVLITGGSKGIGLSIALAFAEEGAQIVLVSRHKSNLDHAMSEIKQRTSIVPDVIEQDLGAAGAAEQLYAQVGAIDVLVNNAGAIPGGSLHDIDEVKWRAAWELKLFSYINLTRVYLADMEQRGSGVIANIIGMAGVAPRYEYICGSAANAALIAFTQGLGGGSVRKGVRVFGINPSPTRSDRMQQMLQNQAQAKWGDSNRWQELTTAFPFARLAEPNELSKLTVFCASPLCGYLSGSVINVDGGQMFTTPKA
jgi:NAD(P)-dependent dehydrogenase (short-subunit alcohol dehydrogenase family)